MKKKAYREMGSLVLLIVALLIWAFAVTCGGGGGGSSSGSSTGTVNTSISDPPTCQPPNGPFKEVWVTITRVRAHTSNNADPNASGWVELVDLRNSPLQIDLLNLESTACVLTQLGSKDGIPAGQYQQIRLYLLSNEEGLPGNKCGSEANNCVVLEAGGRATLNLSSEAQTGIKIPSGQIAGGKFTVEANQTTDLNIDFDACSSIVQQGNGQYRLKPVLHAGEVFLTNLANNSISGQVVKNDNLNEGIENVTVLIEKEDSEDIDRVIIKKLTDSDGKFIFCSLSNGTYDVVVGGKPDTSIYVPTITLGVPLGTAMGKIPLYLALSGSSTIGGQVTTDSNKEVDIDIWALQQANSSLWVTVPVLEGSTPTTVTTVNGTANYTLSVPVGKPMVGSFSSTGTSYNIIEDPYGDYKINGQTSSCIPSSILIPVLSLPSINVDFDFTDCN